MQPIHVMGIVVSIFLGFILLNDSAKDWFRDVTEYKEKKNQKKEEQLIQIIEQQNKLIEELKKDRES